MIEPEKLKYREDGGDLKPLGLRVGQVWSAYSNDPRTQAGKDNRWLFEIVAKIQTSAGVRFVGVKRGWDRSDLVPFSHDLALFDDEGTDQTDLERSWQLDEKWWEYESAYRIKKRRC